MVTLTHARENNIPAILDADIGPYPVPRELVELASHAIFSLPGLAQYTDASDIPTGLRKASEATEALVGVTAGLAPTRRQPHPAVMAALGCGLA